MKKINKSIKEFLDKNPNGKLGDLPIDVREVITNIFNISEEITKEK